MENTAARAYHLPCCNLVTAAGREREELPLLIVTAIILLLVTANASSHPVINEFMASNGQTLQDLQGQWPDWIELHNPSSEPVSLEGWGIADDPEKTPWLFPEVVLEPDEHLIVYASGEDHAQQHTHLILEGGGRDIWDRADSFVYHFVKTDQSSFQITARIDAMTRVHPWAKAGVMVRSSSQTGAAHGFMLLSGQNGFALQYRPLTRAFSEHIPGPPERSSEDAWVRLVRDGDTLRGYMSYDGEQFTQVGEVTFARLPREVQVGVALSSHLEREAAQVRLGSVTLDGAPLEGARTEAIGSRVPYSAETRTYWELHTDFALSRTGEFIGLYNAEGRLVDGLVFDEQQRDVSYGRIPGSSGWAFFTEPTPGGPNVTPPTVAFAPKPRFRDNDGGWWPHEIVVDIAIPAETEVRFTTDGSEPSANDPLWRGPLTITETTVLRARAWRPGLAPSPILSGSFVIGDTPALPILSIITDPLHLDDPQHGIRANPGNSGRLWERPAEASLLLEDGTLLFHYDGLGLRIHGGASRWVDKKSYRLYWREGQVLNLDLFPLKDTVSEFRRLVVRSGGNDQVTGHDGFFAWTLLRCAVMAELFRQEGGLSSSHRPVAVLLNGQLEGVYNLRERIDPYFVEANTGIHHRDVELLKVEHSHVIVPKAGTRDAWDEMLNWFRGADLQDPEQYAYAQTLVDVENFTDFQIFEIYAANWDWPQNNVYKYRDASVQSPWRFILWDLDDAFGFRAPLRHNTLEWALRDRARADLAPPWYDTYGAHSLDSTLMLRRFMANPEYRAFFQQRLDELLQGTLAPDHVEEQLRLAADMVRPGIPWEAERWNTSVDRWESNLESMVRWAQRRPDIVREHWEQYLERIDRKED